MDGISVAYEGSHELPTTRTEPASLPFSIRATEPLPAGTEFRLLIENGYRSLTRWDWEIRNVQVDGHGTVTLTKQVPGTFWERYESRVRPNTLELCRIAVSEAIDSGRLQVTVAGGVTIQEGVDVTIHTEIRRAEMDEFVAIDDGQTIRSVAGAPVSLELRPRAVSEQAEGGYELTVFAADRLQNPVSSFEGIVQLTTDDAVDGLPETITLSGGRAQFAVTPAEVARIHATAPALELDGRSPPLIPSSSGTPVARFGALHFHCRYSHDGDRALDEAYAYAKEWLNLDFASVTDHTPGRNDWQATVDRNDAITDETFAALHAWEWSARSGHANIYLRDASVDAWPAVSEPDEWPSFGHFGPDDPRPHDIEWPEGSFIVPHHTNAQAKARDEHGDRYWETYDWEAPNHRARLVEIYQTRGNFEADTRDEAWDIRVEGRGAAVRDALREGYPLGFTAGTDNHTGSPTRSPRGPGYTGLTGVMTESRSRDAIWNGLHDRRTFATTGPRIHCQFSVAGSPMGTETEAATGEPVSASVRIHGTALVERVEIISNDETVWDATPDALDVTLDDIRLPGPEDNRYYYLRARQRNGEMAWASPVWVTAE